MANDLSLDILVNVTEAISQLGEFESAAAEAAGQVKESFDGIREAGEAALAFLGIEKIAEFFGEFIDGAAKAEASLNQLGGAMAATGTYSDDALASFKEFADKIQDTTKFSAEAVIQQLSVAEAFGATGDKATTLVSAATNLASAMNEDLGTAVEQLGKTLSGSAGRLAQMSPALKDFSAEQLQAGAAVEYFNERYSGAAANDVLTYAGAVAQSHNALEDLEHTLGSLVTDSPTAIARIQGLTETFQSLQTWIVSNKDQLGNIVNVGFEGLATAVPVGVQVLGYLATAFQAVVGTLELASISLSTFADFLVTGLTDAIKGTLDVVLDQVAGFAKLADAIPGASDAMKTLGISSGSLAQTVTDLRSNVDDLADGVVAGSTSMADNVAGFVVKTDAAFKSFDVSLAGVQEGVDAAAQKIFDADTGLSNSAQAAAAVRHNAAQQTIADAKDMQTQLDALAKLEEKIAADGATPAQKAQQEFEKLITAVQQFEDAGVLSHQRAEEDKAAISSAYADKLLKIDADEQKKADAEALKDAQEARKAIEQESSDPIAYHIKAALDGLDVDASQLSDTLGSTIGEAIQNGFVAAQAFAADHSDAIATGLGAAGQALKGAAGAASLLSSGAAAVSDAILPGIGQAVGPLVTALEGGPAQTKAMIDSFVNAIPQLIEAIAQSMPIIVEALVDDLILKGGMARIALAFVEAMVGLPIMQELGKQMGLNFGQSLNPPEVGQKIGAAMGPAFAAGGAKIEASFTSAFAKIGPAMSAAADNFVAPVRKLFQVDVATAITGAFDAPINFFKSLMPTSLKSVFDSAYKELSQFVVDFTNPVKALEAFHIDFPEPSWLKSFLDGIDKFANATGSGGGGGGGVLTQTYHGLIGHAEGIAEIPAGYPDDSYPAGLTTGERVVNPAENSTLGDFLDDYLSGKLNAPVVALLGQVMTLLGQPQTVLATAKVDNRAFADIALTLSRQNARTA